MQVQPVELELGKRAWRRPGPRQRQPQRRLSRLAADAADPGRGQRAPVLVIGDGADLDRPERHVLRRRVGRPRRQPRPEPGHEPRAPRHHVPGEHRLHLLPRLQHRHPHRRGRRDQVRVERVEHRPREARAFGVDLEPGARGKEGDPLEQPLDIGVGAGHAVERQVPRHRRMHLGELARQRPDMRQLVLVVLEKGLVHLRSPGGWSRPARSRGR